jgi:peptide/nickel transport system permease protein
VAFVVAISTMPPLQVTRAPSSTFGYQIRVDTAAWHNTATRYLETIKSGTLGKSREGIPVGQLLHAKLTASLKLLALAVAIALVFGAVKGVRDFDTLRRGRLGVGPLVTGVVQGLPDFWLAIMVQITAVKLVQYLHWRPFPVAYDDRWPIASLVYPLFCLSLIPMAYVARITSTALSAVWDQDYIRTARAKGLPERAVIYRHAVRSALVQILDGLPNALAVTFSNLLIVEALFHVPGITAVIKDAINPALSLTADPRFKPPAPDVPVLVAAGVALGLIFAILYMACSTLRALVDPRLKGREQQ